MFDKVRPAKLLVIVMIGLVLTALSVLIFGQAVAQDNRINPANFHFGGDTLYCEPDVGCHILNLHGVLIATWDQDSIAAAAQQSGETDSSVLVDVRDGTYGQLSLWVQSVGADPNNPDQWRMCMDGYDEWGKWNEICFNASLDGYQAVGVAPAPTSADTPKPVPTMGL